MRSLIIVYLCLLSTLPGICGHGRLTLPQPRACRDGACAIDDFDSPINVNGDEQPETSRLPLNNPSQHPEGQSLVCRINNQNHESSITSITAGGDLFLKWTFTADHPGDGGLYVSYDATIANTQDMKFFKIANFPQMRQQNTKVVHVKLPSWLPPGRAVLRWDWYATHNYPHIEFYAHCIDVNVVSSSNVNPSVIPSYKIEHNTGRDGSYPRYDDESKWFCGDCEWEKADWLNIGLVGPKCVTGVTGNCCDMSSYQPTARSGAGFPICARVGTSGTATWLSPSASSSLAVSSSVSPSATSSDSSSISVTPSSGSSASVTPSISASVMPSISANITGVNTAAGQVGPGQAIVMLVVGAFLWLAAL